MINDQTDDIQVDTEKSIDIEKTINKKSLKKLKYMSYVFNDQPNDLINSAVLDNCMDKCVSRNSKKITKIDLLKKYEYEKLMRK